MKKTNKKISKLLKVSLLLCMIFSQLASPIKVLADQVVPSYNLDIVLDDKADEDVTNDEFVVTSNGTKELVVDENYIIEIIRSFKYVDGSLYEEENSTSYMLETGASLTNGVSVLHETFGYNGVSYTDVNVYEVVDDTIDISTYLQEEYPELLASEKVEKIMYASFGDGEGEEISLNKTSLEFVVDGAVCDSTEGYKCNVTKNDISNLVKINYNLEKGNFNPNKKYYTLLKVNGVAIDLITSDIDSQLNEFEIDFSKMLPGVYNVEYLVADEGNNAVVSDKIEFTYVDEVLEGEEELDRLDFMVNSTMSLELFYNYTVLTDLEKEELGNEYAFLDTPIAFAFDELVEFNQGELVSSYNMFDEEGNRYHAITSEQLIGAFNDESISYKVGDVLAELQSVLDEFYYASASVVDADGNKVNETSFISNGMKLLLDVYGNILEYDFLVYGDVDGGFVEKSDISALIDKTLNNNFSYYDTLNLDLNADGKIDIVDISILGLNVYSQEFYVGEYELTDTITGVLESEDEEVIVGDSFEVLLSFDGFEVDYFNAIEGNLVYDSEALSLDKIEVLDDLFVGNYLNNRFIYASEELFDQNEVSFVKLTFTSLAVGTQKISVSDLTLVSDGILFGETKTNELEIIVNRPLHTDANLKSLTSSVGYFDKAFDSEVLEYTLYVDSSVYSVTLGGELSDEYATTEDFKQYVLTGDNTIISINVTAEDGTVKTYKVTVRKIYKSSNNNLSNLVIEGYDIDFNKDVLEYNITVGSDVTSLDISAIVEHGGAWAKIEGNENFQEGENVVTITVYAENGSAKTYKLIVNKEKIEGTPVVEENDNNVNTEKVVIIILIILVVIGLLYLIFKKDEEEDAPRIEQIKPKKEPEVKHSEVDKNIDNNKNKYKDKK